MLMRQAGNISHFTRILYPRFFARPDQPAATADI
jgi:hypothetical protein